MRISKVKVTRQISFLYLEIVDVTNKDANFGRLNCPDPQDNLRTTLIPTIPPNTTQIF